MIMSIYKEDEKYQILLTGSTVRIFDLQGNEKTVNYEVDKTLSQEEQNNERTKLLKYITTNNPVNNLQMTNIGDYTFILNKTITAQLSDETYPNPYPNSAMIFHNNPTELWKAARPCITWGYPLRILSTHNGQSCLYYKFLDQVKRGKLKWSHHKTPIQLAVAEGLVDKIFGRKTTKAEQEEWLEEERKNCFDEYTWLQEYCCVAIDEACAFLPYELITPCEMTDILKSLETIKGDLYVGIDIGRRKDLTVIWCLERFENSKYTRKVKVLEKTPFHIQYEIISAILRHPKLRRCCIDSTGIGMQLAETAQKDFGKYLVEMVMFTNKSKEEIPFSNSS